jgi:tryptophan 2,3-dioxygenase
MSRRPESGRPAAARAVLNPAEPNPLLRYEYDRGSNYEVDSRLTLVLSALVPEDELICPDHRFFQIVHLVTELSWCAMHHEIRRAAAALAEDDLMLAVQLLDRTVGLAGTPVAMVRQLVRQLPQVNLLTMRAAFPPNTTGLDSPGARNLRRASTALWQGFEAALHRHRLALPDLTGSAALERPGERPPWTARGLAAVRDGLHRLDLAVQEWKHVHLRLVWSQLGGHPEADPRPAGRDEDDLPTSLRGRPISDVERMAQRPLFPPLWQELDNTYRAAVEADRTGTEPSEVGTHE